MGDYEESFLAEWWQEPKTKWDTGEVADWCLSPCEERFLIQLCLTSHHNVPKNVDLPGDRPIPTVFSRNSTTHSHTHSCALSDELIMLIKITDWHALSWLSSAFYNCYFCNQSLACMPAVWCTCEWLFYSFYLMKAECFCAVEIGR